MVGDCVCVWGVLMTEKERKYLDKEMFKDLVGYCQYLDRKTDETRVYNCGGLPVEVTLPEGEHDKQIQLE